MHTRYRIALAALAWLTLLVVVPPFINDLARAVAKTDAGESWAAIGANVSRFGRFLVGTPAQAAEAAPLTLQDFAGTWANHNNYLRIAQDGTAAMGWRRGGAGVEPGSAAVTIDRVEGRTLYGTALTTNYPDGIVAGPFTLTEYEYGVGYLMDGDAVGMVVPGAPYDPHYGRTLCGPRFAAAPDWFKATSPCGA